MDESFFLFFSYYNPTNTFASVPRGGLEKEMEMLI